MHCTFNEFIILLYTFLVSSFSRYKENIIFLNWFSSFSNVLPAFTCPRAIGNLWSIWVGANIFNNESEGRPVTSICRYQKIPLLEALRNIPLPLWSAFKLPRIYRFCFFFIKSLGFAKDVLLNRIEEEHKSCHTDLVINALF